MHAQAWTRTGSIGRAVVALALALVVGLPTLVVAAPASAHARHAKHARGHRGHHRRRGQHPMLGAIPARTHGSRARARAAAIGGNLTYHGGPVMHSNTTYAIYWGCVPGVTTTCPSGLSSFPTGYRSAIDTYLGDVAHDSGLHSNVFATDAQYTDGTGHAAYDSTFGGSFVDDAQPYPTSTTVASCYASNPPDPNAATIDHCLTDAQLEQEVSRVVNAQHLPRDLSHLYFIFTPSGVGSCDGGECAYTNYCAYHSWNTSSGTLLYANQPYAAGDPTRCSIIADSPRPALDTISLASHEHNEAITDPTQDGWFDSSGNENGDKCAWDFGLGQFVEPPSGDTNQTINGHGYELQLEWDNASSRCQLGLPTGSLDQAAGDAGAPITFNAGESVAGPGQTIASAKFSFGDGSTVTGSSLTAQHTYAAGGTYTVSVTVTDSAGAKDTATRSVTVTGNRPPVAAFSFTPGSPVAGQPVSFTDGSSDPDGTIASWSWSFGDGGTSTDSSPTHTFTAAGTYTVKLTVTDNDGAPSSVSQNVVVGPPPAAAPPSPPPSPPTTVSTSGGSSSGSSNGGAAGGQAANSHSAPLSLRFVVARHVSLRRLLRSGLPFQLRCSSACRVTVTLALDRATARRLHLGSSRRSLVLGTVTGRRSTPGTVRLRLRLNRRWAGRTAVLRSLTVGLTASAPGPDGGLARSAARVTLLP